MADTSISNLTATSPATAAHRIPIAITPFGSGNNGYITPALILSYGTSPITGTTITATTQLVGAKVSESVTAGAGWTITAGTATTAVSALSVTRTNNNALVTNVVSIAATETTQAAFGTYNNFAVYGGAAGADLALGIGKHPQAAGSSSPYITIGGYLGNSTIGSYAGQLTVGNAAATAVGYMSHAQISLISTATIGFAVGSNGIASTDTAISRISAGVIGVGTGAAGSFAGTLQLEQLTVGNGASINHNANRLQFNSSTERAMQISNYNQSISFFNTYILAWASTGDANGTLDTSLSRISAGLVGIGTAAAGFAGRLKLTSTIVAATTVAALNASPTVGEISTVNDALAVTAKGATVTAGGSAIAVLVWNGTNWVGI